MKCTWPTWTSLSASNDLCCNSCNFEFVAILPITNQLRRLSLQEGSFQAVLSVAKAIQQYSAISVYQQKKKYIHDTWRLIIWIILFSIWFILSRPNFKINSTRQCFRPKSCFVILYFSANLLVLKRPHWSSNNVAWIKQLNMYFRKCGIICFKCNTARIGRRRFDGENIVLNYMSTLGFDRSWIFSK